jgi:tetratricopeptide (TPR) repeat protein
LPEGRLGVLDEGAVDELVGLASGQAGYSAKETGDVLRRYEGHPYALGAAFELMEAGVGVEELPTKAEPTKFAEVQWRKVCENGDEAIDLLQGYAILEVGVGGEIIEGVSGLKGTSRKRLQSNKYIGGFLRQDGEGQRIYHAILADHILGQMSGEEITEYHRRAAAIYRAKLATAEKEQVKPDELAATRLAEHVLAAEGEEAFVDTFITECVKVLYDIGLLDTVIDLSKRALGIATKGSQEEANLTGNLGLIYHTKGELERAEEMQKKSLEINERLGNQGGMASSYGNLGLIYRIKGELEQAEEMQKKSLEIDERLGNQGGMAVSYVNLGVIYETKGELDKAEDMVNKALEIQEKFGQQEGMAASYDLLGLIYQTKGDLDLAEEKHKKALAISERLGLQQGTANSYANLGVIYEARGDMQQARMHWEMARGLYEKIGIVHEAEQMEGWLDSLEEE